MNLVDRYTAFVYDGIRVTHSGKAPKHADGYRASLYAIRLKGQRSYLYYIKKSRNNSLFCNRVVDSRVMQALIDETYEERPDAIVMILDLKSLSRHAYLMLRGEIFRSMQPEQKGEPVWNVNGDEPIA